jgi:hypothetical protein
MFLSDAELVELTGYRQAAKQAAHLRAQRVPFHTNRAGRPVVVRSVWRAIKAEQQARTDDEARLQAIRWGWDLEARASHMAKRMTKINAAKAVRDAMPAPVFRLSHRLLRRPPKSQSSALRRARIRQRTPAWANKGEIRAVYAEAKRLTQATGVEHHVDHYYPIAGRHVSGLHVHHNLRCLPAEENKRKHNHFEAEE